MIEAPATREARGVDPAHPGELVGRPAGIDSCRESPPATKRALLGLRDIVGLGLASLVVCGCLLGCDEGRRPEPGPGETAEGSAGQPAATAVAEIAAELEASRATPTIDRSRGVSRDAKLDTFEMLVEDMSSPRHESDGGGRGWIESVENEQGEAILLHAGERARIRLVYEAGPLGIAAEGSLFFQLSPFWGWDPPQNAEPDARGYTEVSSAVKDLEIDARWLGSELMGIQFPGRGLRPGERIRVVYGAGPALAHVDSYAEHRSRIWFAVDGDGDGIRSLVPDSPSVDIAAGEASRLVVVVPSSARPGEEVTVRVSVLDAKGSMGAPYAGEIRLLAPEGIELPESVLFEPKHEGRRQFAARIQRPGIYRIEAIAPLPQSERVLHAESNPLVSEADIPRLRWADLHGHSQLSDGTGTPEDYFRYARDVAGLDAIALTDHDHWGMQFLDSHPKMWQEIKRNVADFHEPGRFVTVLGYEWTSWIHGHRHVLYFGDEGEILSTLDPDYETPAQLWAGLRGQPALTFAHHSAGGPISTNWNYPPDPELEPVTEIVSVHGSSESEDSPGAIYNPVRGNFVRDVLDAGYRFGFIGSGDSHDGHPGEAHLASPGGGGLAAIFSDELSREGIRQAMKARRVYATNGARIWLEVSIDGEPMGSTLTAEPENSPGEPEPALVLQRLRIRVVAESPLERVDLIRSGRVAEIPLDGELDWTHERQIPRLLANEYHYVRVIQTDGGTAWSSPIYAGSPGP